MVINFRVHEISWDTRKLTHTPSLILKKNLIGGFIFCCSLTKKIFNELHKMVEEAILSNLMLYIGPDYADNDISPHRPLFVEFLQLICRKYFFVGTLFVWLNALYFWSSHKISLALHQVASSSFLCLVCFTKSKFMFLKEKNNKRKVF
jgi:hypothetical protein